MSTRQKVFLIALFLVILLSSSPSHAVSRFERFLLNDPRAFRFLTFGVAALAGIIIFLQNYLSGRGETILMRKRSSQQKRVEKEVAERQKAYEEIPSGSIGDVSLPPAKFIHLGFNQEHEISPIRELTIGRSAENIVVLERSSVSRSHAKIRPEKEGYVLYDLLSTVGTYVNDEKIMKRTLRDGDVVGIGREDFIFKL